MDIRRSGESPNQSEGGGGENKSQQTNQNNGGSTGIVGPMLVIFVLIILAVAGIYLFSGEGNTTNSTTTSEVSGPVARVGGEPIEAQTFNEQLSAQRGATTSRSAQQFQSLSETQQQESILNNLINRELLRQSAINAGVSVSDSEVDERLQSQIEQVGGESEFEQRLSELGLTRAEAREDLREQMLLTQFVSQNVGTTTDAEVQQRYNQLSDQQLQQYSQVVNRRSAGTSTQGTPTLEDIRPILERQISVQKQQQVVRRLLQEARNSIEVEVLLDGVSYPPEAQQQTQPQPQQQPRSQSGQQQQPQPGSDTEATTDGDSAEQETDTSATGTDSQ
jgi:peptidyl-prolyl cis-trans isomerase SurA